MDWWIGGLVDWWIGGWVDGWMDEWIGELVDWWMGGWVDGWMDGLPLLKQLHWLPVNYRIKFKLSTLTYRSLAITSTTLSG